MIKQVELSHEADSGTDRLSAAETLHRTLDTRLQELGRRSYLTPDEQVEVADLKKQKLKLKDEIQSLRVVST